MSSSTSRSGNEQTKAVAEFKPVSLSEALRLVSATQPRSGGVTGKYPLLLLDACANFQA